MAEKYEEISELVIAYITNQLSEDQKQFLDAWVDESPANKKWLEQWDDYSWIASELEEYNKPDVDKSFGAVWALIEKEECILQPAPVVKRTSKLRPVWKYVVSVAAVIALSISAWQGYDHFWGKSSLTVTTTNTDNKGVDPVYGKHVVLSLVDDAPLIVDNMPNGVIYSRAGVNVVKQDGILQYIRVGNDDAAYNVTQTISTGRGKSMQVVLPDSSIVWLNAASSISFRLAYNAVREVATRGDVCIRVQKDQLHPFCATAGNLKVMALGTMFNINTYDDTRKVTLLEGKIQIKTNRVETTLGVPGETALIYNDSIKIDRYKNFNKVRAWQMGAFTFNEDPIVEVLSEIERWYGVPVKYLNIPPTIISHSSFPRNKPLPFVVDLLNQVDSNLNISINTFKQDSVLIVSYQKK